MYIAYVKNTKNNTAAYTNNIVELLNSDPNRFGPLLKVTMVLDRRDVNAAEANQVMRTGHNRYSYQSFVFINPDPNYTVKQWGEFLARALTEYSGHNSRYGPSEFTYLHDATTTPPQPINHFFIDCDTVK